MLHARTHAHTRGEDRESALYLFLKCPTLILAVEQAAHAVIIVKSNVESGEQL